MSRELVRAYVDRLPAGSSPDRSLFRLGADEVGGQFYGARLSSVFQRVVTADGREIGHQGLVRSRSADDATLSPWRLFADTATDDELVQLDRLARTLHALNYFGVLILVALIECVVPRRGPGDTLALRWFGNATMAVLGTIMVRSLFPILGLAWAVLCHERGWGLFNRIGLPRDLLR
jgi:hypothetical protein